MNKETRHAQNCYVKRKIICQADEIMRQATADGGKRFVRAKELAVEYSINNGMKIKELQESVDKK